MNAEDHVNQQIYDVMEALVEKLRERSKIKQPNQTDQQKYPLETKTILTSKSSKELLQKLKENPSLFKKVVRIYNQHYLQQNVHHKLSTTKNKLQLLQEKLEQTPERYKREIAKANELEAKLNRKLEKFKEREKNHEKSKSKHPQLDQA